MKRILTALMVTGLLASPAVFAGGGHGHGHGHGHDRDKHEWKHWKKHGGNHHGWRDDRVFVQPAPVIVHQQPVYVQRPVVVQQYPVYQPQPVYQPYYAGPPAVNFNVRIPLH